MQRSDGRVLASIQKPRTWPDLNSTSTVLSALLCTPKAKHMCFVRLSYHPALAHWYKTKSGPSFSPKGFNLLERMFEYDPSKRITAKEALDSGFFKEADGVNLK